MIHRRTARLLLALVLAGTGCGGHRTATIRNAADLSWPSEEPRVRLENTIDLRDAKPGKGRRFLGWLGGAPQTVLFQRPWGVAWDGADLLVTDPGGGRVARIRPDGRMFLSPEGAVGHPMGIAACARGILVSDSVDGSVAVLDADLAPTQRLADRLSRPTAIGCSGEQVFLVETGEHRIQVLGPGGGARSLGRRGALPGEFNFPAALAVDGATLLVGDTLNFRVQRLDARTGEPLATFGNLGDSPGETPRIKGVAVDAAGHIWVSDAILDRVSLFDRDGALLLSIGGTGSEPGQFSFPAGIAAHADGRIAVADSLNRRLQVFRIVPEGDPGA